MAKLDIINLKGEKTNDLKLQKVQIELMKQQEKEIEDSRFTELDNLFRSIK